MVSNNVVSGGVVEWGSMREGGKSADACGRWMCAEHFEREGESLGIL